MNREKPSALIEFRARNIYSFDDTVFLRLTPEISLESQVVRVIPNIAPGTDLRKKPPHEILPVLAIVGANASGKTNALKALAFMRQMVNTSHNQPPGLNIPRPYFRANDPFNPSTFYIEFLQEGIRYEYGFSMSDNEILEEWAASYPKGARTSIFERKNGEVKIGTKSRKVLSFIADNLLKKNTLFLSVTSQINLDATAPLTKWFQNNLKIINPQVRPVGNSISTEMLKDPEKSKIIMGLMKAADLGIIEAQVEPMEPEQLERIQLLIENVIRAQVKAASGSEEVNFDSNQPVVADVVSFLHSFGGINFKLDMSEESTGTIAWFGLLGLIWSALQSGETILIDEMDSSLHPQLLIEAIKLFQNPEMNTNLAQLIFNCHSIPVFDWSKGQYDLRRDQILIAKKDDSGSSTLYPLYDVAKSNDEAFSKRYLQGYYGGVPYLKFQTFAQPLKDILELAESN